MLRFFSPQMINFPVDSIALQRTRSPSRYVNADWFRLCYIFVSTRARTHSHICPHVMCDVRTTCTTLTLHKHRIDFENRTCDRMAHSTKSEKYNLRRKKNQTRKKKQTIRLQRNDKNKPINVATMMNVSATAAVRLRSVQPMCASHRVIEFN